MKFLAFAVSAIVLTTTAANADPIADRKALMEERADQMKVLVPIAQQKQPYDAAAVMAALNVLNENAKRSDVDALWPEGTQVGDTKSAPSIWSERESFKEAMDKYDADVAAAAAANPQTLEAFLAVFGPIGSGCGSCHQKFRF